MFPNSRIANLTHELSEVPLIIGFYITNWLILNYWFNNYIEIMWENEILEYVDILLIVR